MDLHVFLILNPPPTSLPRMIFKVDLSLAQLVKKLPTMQETQVQFLYWQDPLEKVMATHSSIIAWEIPWTEKPGGLQSMGPVARRHD